MSHEDRAVPFTLRNIKEDLEDIGSMCNGPLDLEFRAATKALELKNAALSYQRVPPGYRSRTATRAKATAARVAVASLVRHAYDRGIKARRAIDF